MSQDDFASMMQQAADAAGGRTRTRFRAGQVVKGTVVQIGHDSVFVDVGSTVEGRIDRRELEDDDGALKVAPGDVVSASVVSADDVDGPRLSVSLGRGSSRGLDLGALESARDGRVPVEGVVGAVVKGGVEVRVLGARGFCPASQLSSEFVGDLSSFEGQKLEFLVTEVKNGGRDVVVSRKALLLEQRDRQARATLESLQVNGDYPGTVVSLQKYGAFIDLGAGVEGLIHVSELSHGRVERVEDVLSVGEAVTVRLLAIQPPEKRGDSPKLRLSLRALTRNEAPEPNRGEVLEGSVSRIATYGVFVDTPKGSGLVPTRELGIPRGSDARRQFPIGQTVRVVLLSGDPSRGLTFSIARVASVEERQNYQEFAQMQKTGAASAAGLGSFGELLRQELGLPEPEPEPPPPSTPPSPPPAAARTAAPAPAAAPRVPQPAPAARPPIPPPASPRASGPPAPLPADRARVDVEPVRSAPKPQPRGPKGPPDGVIRGRRRPKGPGAAG